MRFCSALFGFVRHRPALSGFVFCLAPSVLVGVVCPHLVPAWARVVLCGCWLSLFEFGWLCFVWFCGCLSLFVFGLSFLCVLFVVCVVRVLLVFWSVFSFVRFVCLCVSSAFVLVLFTLSLCVFVPCVCFLYVCFLLVVCYVLVVVCLMWCVICCVVFVVCCFRCSPVVLCCLLFVLCHWFFVCVLCGSLFDH